MQRRAEPPADYSARHTEQPIRCQGCGRLLAVARGGVVTMRHRGRTIEAERVRSITCEDCGGVWRPSSADDRARRGVRFRMG